MSHACHRFWKCYKTLTFCSLLTRCTVPCACHAKRHLNVQKWSKPLVLLTFWLRNLLHATTACTFSTSKLQKVVRTWCALYILTWKRASRHSGAHFFDVSISKSGPRMVCFVHFDFEMCFAPQWRALFRHLDFQKWSGAAVSCAFWLGNVLRATTTCNFSFLIWPAGSAPAALASLLFDPLEPQIIGKTQCLATFLPFFWLFLFSDLLSSALLFSILLLHLCFSSVHIVGSLTSKLPSIIYIYRDRETWINQDKPGDTPSLMGYVMLCWWIIIYKPLLNTTYIYGLCIWINHLLYVGSTSKYLQVVRTIIEKPG